MLGQRYFDLIMISQNSDVGPTSGQCRVLRRRICLKRFMITSRQNCDCQKIDVGPTLLFRPENDYDYYTQN